ncbi:MAG TPA: hypothetical protein VLK22_01330 [Candidatus Udaeobacter sp.]|nr:hypothetical protein [Candidatus Udaeobacter sp.]
MAEKLAENGDHIVLTGDTDVGTGMERAVVFHHNGTSSNVLVSEGGKGGQDFFMEPCGEFGYMETGVGHVRVGSGHNGPPLVNCSAFRQRIVDMFGEHPLDPSHPDNQHRA